ncbi:MAG: ABC-2 type transport system ATP-binding protein [Parcubacteria group bacterium Gr01-1014_38]|nr:MAG: ABC-2 type transport system ATP-binding protein [Parcubacteria group bacterium Gr01-1014_38]
MPEPVIEVRDLRKVFAKTVAVDGISFSVQKGEILGFLGPNGAGKTTTIAMLLGLLTPTSGTISIFGKSMPKDRQHILQRVNFSSPYTNMPYGLPVMTNLKIFSRLYTIPNAAQKISALAETFGVAHLLKRRTMTLSSGETARVNLLKAFLNDPEILFLDEPTASLDPEAADTVRSLLLKLQKERGLTIFYTSHNMQEVERLSHRIIFLHRGKVIAEGTPESVRKQHGGSLEEFFIALARSETTPPAAHSGHEEAP